MIKKLLLLKLVLSVSILSTFVSAQIMSDTALQRNKHLQTKVTYCNLPVIKQLQKGNLFYSFVINENGNAVDVTNVRNPNDASKVFVAAKSCIENWEIKGFPPKSGFAVFFEWRSEKGWVEQRISGAGISYYVKKTGLSGYVKPNLERQMTINFCDLETPEKSDSKNNALFLRYSFKLNRSGKVLRIKKINNDYIEDDKIKSCISNWNIKGFPTKSKVTVSFKWNKETGWNEQVISDNNFEQSIILESEK